MSNELFHDAERTRVVDAVKSKTLYDWAPGKRGKLLASQGSSSLQMTIPANMPGVLGDVLGELYRGERLTGQALEDARAQKTDI